MQAIQIQLFLQNKTSYNNPQMQQNIRNQNTANTQQNTNINNYNNQQNDKQTNNQLLSQKQVQNSHTNKNKQQKLQSTQTSTQDNTQFAKHASTITTPPNNQKDVNVQQQQGLDENHQQNSLEILENNIQLNDKTIKILSSQKFEEDIRKAEERLLIHEQAQAQLKREISIQEIKTQQLAQQMNQLKRQAASKSQLRKNQSSLPKQQGQDDQTNENQDFDQEEFTRKLEQVKRELTKQTEMLNRLQTLHEEPLFRTVNELETCLMEEHPELCNVLNIKQFAKHTFATYKKEYINEIQEKLQNSAQMRREREKEMQKVNFAQKQVEEAELAQKRAHEAELELQRILEGKERRRKMYEEALTNLKQKKAEAIRQKAEFEAQRRKAAREQELKTEDKLWAVKLGKTLQNDTEFQNQEHLNKKEKNKHENIKDSKNVTFLNETNKNEVIARDTSPTPTMIHKATTLCLDDLLQQKTVQQSLRDSKRINHTDEVKVQAELQAFPEDIDTYLDENIVIPDVLDRLFAQNKQRWIEMQSNTRQNWNAFNQQGILQSIKSKTRGQLNQQAKRNKNVMKRLPITKLQTPDNYCKRTVITKPLQDIPITNQGEIFPLYQEDQREIQTRRKQYLGRRDFVEIQLNHKSKVNKIFDEMQELQMAVIMQDQLNNKELKTK